MILLLNFGENLNEILTDLKFFSPLERELNLQQNSYNISIYILTTLLHYLVKREMQNCRELRKKDDAKS